MLPIFLSLFTFLASAEAPKLHCLNGKLSIRVNGEAKIEKVSYCTNGDKTILMSKDFDRKRVAKRSVTNFENINPGFKLCHDLGGTAELVSFLDEGKWHELDRCLFKDKSFIDTGSLYQLSY